MKGREEAGSRLSPSGWTAAGSPAAGPASSGEPGGWCATGIASTGGATPSAGAAPAKFAR